MISIRPVVETDLEAFYEHQIDPDALAMAVFGGAREHDAFIAHWREILADSDAVARTVLVDEDVVGNVGSWSHDGLRYVAYWIDRAWWGQGVGSEALRLLVTEISERPLWAMVVVPNIGSQRVLEKSGFVQVTRQPSPKEGVEEFGYRLD